MDNKDKQYFYKIRGNVLEMLSARGHTISQELTNISLDEFGAMSDNDSADIYIKNDNTDIFIYFYNKEKSFGKKELKDVVQTTKDSYGEYVNILLILNKYNKTAIDKELINIYYSNVEYMPAQIMTFNITDNYLVPKHILLTPDEKQKVLDQYNTDTLDSFPILKKDDAQAKYYGMKTGDLCKIIRSCPTAGVSIYYRGVV
jgi:DNA-directed RNA polymerase I, II, and III subunit RPABC1